MDKIAIFLGNYLNISETFIYQRIINFRSFKPIVLCYKVRNLDAFPFDPIYSFADGLRKTGGFKRFLFANLGFSPSFEKVLRTNEVRLIQVHFAPRAMEMEWLSRKLGIPQVNFFHGTDLDAFIVNGKASKRLTDLISSTALSVVNSRYMKQLLVSAGCDPKKIEINYAGIDLEKFAFKPRPSRKEGDPVRILMCGRLVWKKGLEFGIRAFAAVLREHPYLSMEIIGEGDKQKELEDLVARLGISHLVRFLGALPSDGVLEKMRSSDILLFPSLSEGAPNVPKEALAAGLPVIATNVCGTPEIIDDGQNGFLVPPSDASALESKLRYFLEHVEIWPKIALEGRKKAETRFDVKKQMAELESFYKRIIYGGRSKVEKAAVICSSTARVLHPQQGATQINAFEATRRYKRYEPHLFSCAFAGRPLEETVDGVNIHRIWSAPMERAIFSITHFKGPDFIYVKKVADRMKKLGIKIAHVRNRPLYVPYLRKLLGKDVKIILHEHNQNIADTLSRRQALEVLNAVDAYVGVSKFTMDYEITGRYPEFASKSHYILNGVDTQKFRPIWERPKERDLLRQKYGLTDSKVVLFVGAIRERKGIHFLVRAMKEVIKKHPKAKLVIAGGSAKNIEPKDHFAQTVKNEAQALGGNVVDLGFVSSENISDTYLLADIFAGPSTWDEPFGLVFAEASASGLPVIASRRGGIPEVILGGKTGLLVDDPADINDLSKKINYLLERPEVMRQFGENGRKLMADKFSWEGVAGEIEDLYDSLLAVKL